MATSAISSGDISILRSTAQHPKNLVAHITPLTSVQSGTISAVASTYPTVSVTWDGSTSGIEVGQYVRITSGSTIVAHGVIRKAPSGSTLYIGETPLGGAGYAQNIETAIATSQTVTVYSHHPMWCLHSRINNKTFYKFWDTAYTDQNENVPPVANIGKHQSAKISSGTASFTLPDSGSNTSFSLAGTISSHSWSLPSGVSLATGYSATDAVIVVDADPGAHLIKYTVTDSNAKTATAYRWLFVSDGTTGTSLSERYVIPSVQINQDKRGFTGSFEIIGTSLDSILYPGAMVYFKETPYFSAGTLTSGVFIDTHVGYIVDISYTYDEDRISRASVTFESPLIYANRVNQPVQSLTEVSNANNWAECSSNLSNPSGAFFYAVKWHTPALLDMHDFVNNSLTTPRRKYLDFNTNTLGEAIDNVTKMFLVTIGSRADGSSVMNLYPQYMNNTDRNALAVRFSWQAQDFLLPLSYRKNIMDKPAFARSTAFAYNGSVTAGWHAGKFWNQGTGRTELANFTVTMSEGLERVKEVVGHYYAEQSAEIRELSFGVRGNMDVIDPCDMLWDRLTISSTYDPRGTGWTNERMLCTRVSRQWQVGDNGLEKQLSFGFKPETFGQPGEEIPIGKWKQGRPVVPVPFTPQAGEAFGSLGLMIAVNDTGNLAVTYDYLSDSPTWLDLTGKFTGDVCDFDWDYNSAYFTNGYLSTDQLSIYVCTISGTTFYVYRIPDIKDPLSVPVELTSATMNDSSTNYNGRIKCSETTPTLVLAAWKDQTGVEFIRSTDGGSNWSSKANVGSAVTDTNNDDAHFGMDIIGTTQLITAPDATPEYGLYMATTAGGAFSAVTNTTRSVAPQPMVKAATSSIAYVSDAQGLYTDYHKVTFDAGGDSYSLGSSHTGWTLAVTTGGNPDNCYKGTLPSNVGFYYFDVNITLASAQSIANVLADAYSSATLISGSNDMRVTMTFRNGGSGGTITGSIYAIVSIDGTWATYSSWTGSSFPFTADYVNVRSGCGALLSGMFTGVDLRIDNLNIQIANPTTATLYKITSLDTAPSWNGVSPASGKIPARPHDLAIDIIDNNVLNTVTDNTVWYQSINAATSWSSKEASTTKLTPYSVGDAIVFGGTSEVILTLDNGTTEGDKTGDLSSRWTIDNIKKVLAL